MLLNPLIVAPLLALPVSVYCLELPAFLVRSLEVLSNAAGAAALFATGLSFVRSPFRIGFRELGTLVLLKMVFHPACVAVLALLMLPIESQQAKAAILLSSLPTGALASVLASQRGRYVQQSSSVIIASTAVSLISIPLLVSIW